MFKKKKKRKKECRDPGFSFWPPDLEKAFPERGKETREHPQPDGLPPGSGPGKKKGGTAKKKKKKGGNCESTCSLPISLSSASANEEGGEKGKVSGKKKKRGENSPSRLGRLFPFNLFPPRKKGKPEEKRKEEVGRPCPRKTPQHVLKRGEERKEGGGKGGGGVLTRRTSAPFPPKPRER